MNIHNKYKNNKHSNLYKNKGTSAKTKTLKNNKYANIIKYKIQKHHRIQRYKIQLQNTKFPNSNTQYKIQNTQNTKSQNTQNTRQNIKQYRNTHKNKKTTNYKNIQKPK